MARLALLAARGRRGVRVEAGAAPARARRAARVDARRHGHGGHVLGGEAPPSYVLGNLANAPSGLLGPMSGIFLLVGMYWRSASQLGAPLTAATVNPGFYIAGSLCVPVSWASTSRRIQKKNDDKRARRAPPRRCC